MTRPVEPLLTLLPRVLMAVGLLMIADSLSQLVMALGPWEPSSSAWRVNAFRLLFTQVTPLVLGGVLVVVSCRLEAPVRGLGIGMLGLAILVAVTAGWWLVEAAAGAPTRAGPASTSYRRTLVQGGVSAASLVLGLTVGGWLVGRRRAA